jgi:hypothetical protein
LYEKLIPTPPLYANGILFLLAIFISARAFRDFPTIRDVLAVRPPPREKFRIMDWPDDILDDPVFPEMRPSGPTKKVKNKDAWGHQCSDWQNGRILQEVWGYMLPAGRKLSKSTVRFSF